MRVSYYGKDSRQNCDFGGDALGIAASDNDFAARILPSDPPDGCPCILFGGGRNRTGVQNYIPGGIPVGRSVQPQFAKLVLDSGTVSLGSAAAEIFYVKAGHRTILAYVVSRALTAGASASLALSRYQ